MTYTEATQYLFQQFPSFKKYGSKAVKYGLENIEALGELLHNPHQQFKAIHIAGTNGKGSVTHILAAIFMQAGFKTATLTSPHYNNFRERIKINGQYIPEETVIDFIEKYQTEIDQLQASFFEITTAMAFWYFAHQQVDMAIIETGLGGRLDSTNILQPQLSVITNIGLDHQQMLGNSLSKIAYEKGGIIKQNTPIVIGKRQQETQPVFKEVAIKKNAPIYFSDDLLTVEKPSTIDINYNHYPVQYYQTKEKIILQSDLKGSYQAQNLQTALAAIEVYQKQYNLKLDRPTLNEAIKNLKSKTGLLGKWMILQQAPLTIADSAHNEDGIQAALESIQTISYKKLHIVFGMMKDKAINPILRLLPKDAQYYFCSPNIKRALAVETLLTKAKVQGLSGEAYTTVMEAFETAKQKAHKEDLVLIIGSCFVVAEVL